MVTFSSQLTTSLYKLAIHGAIFRPTLRHQITACDVMSLVTTPI